MSGGRFQCHSVKDYPLERAKGWLESDIADYRRIEDAAFDFPTDDSPQYGIELRVVRFPIGDGFESIVTNLPEEEFGAIRPCTQLVMTHSQSLTE